MCVVCNAAESGVQRVNAFQLRDEGTVQSGKIEGVEDQSTQIRIVIAGGRSQEFNDQKKDYEGLIMKHRKVE